MPKYSAFFVQNRNELSQQTIARYFGTFYLDSCTFLLCGGMNARVRPHVR